MGYEIDFLPVGEGEKCGDAIALRYGNITSDPPQQKVIVIDGGTKESGKELINHIDKYYKTKSVDLVICSHSDADHSSGLSEVLTELEVSCLMMHRPWAHITKVASSFEDGRVTIESLKKRLTESCNNVQDLEDIAIRKSIKVIEPFSDYESPLSNLLILSPSVAFYESLLPKFRDLPKIKERELSLMRLVAEAIKEKIILVAEKWNKETLKDPGENETSAENNTSTILLLKIEGRKFLFTGDAGILALAQAIERAAEIGIDLRTANFVQVPHHGSRHNIGPSLLNQIIGPILPYHEFIKTAVVSAPKDGAPKHPAKKVTNAFQRRGAKVFSTSDGRGFCHHSNDVPSRPRWRDATPLEFYDEVDEWE